MVDGTGFAPARAFAHEFLRLACIHSTTRRKIGAAGATCTPTRGEAQRFLKPLCLLVPSTAAKLVATAGVAPARTNLVQRGLSPPCLQFQPRREKLVRAEGVAPSWACARRLLGPARLLVPPRPHRMDPARRVALRSSQYHWGASLPTLCRNKIGRGERTCTSGARQGGAFTARCNCCSATPRKLGARAGFAPATFSL